mmetsp:Transcript_40428/g.95758  ORF Transcript_40428/g.95758 Transcript_40428/m.95758 type:complete len:301 (-) Transcript_40428:1509-2411(-)
MSREFFRACPSDSAARRCGPSSKPSVLFSAATSFDARTCAVEATWSPSVWRCETSFVNAAQRSSNPEALCFVGVVTLLPPPARPPAFPLSFPDGLPLRARKSIRFSHTPEFCISNVDTVADDSKWPMIAARLASAAFSSPFSPDLIITVPRRRSSRTTGVASSLSSPSALDAGKNLSHTKSSIAASVASLTSWSELPLCPVVLAPERAAQDARDSGERTSSRFPAATPFPLELDSFCTMNTMPSRVNSDSQSSPALHMRSCTRRRAAKRSCAPSDASSAEISSHTWCFGRSASMRACSMK